MSAFPLSNPSFVQRAVAEVRRVQDGRRGRKRAGPLPVPTAAADLIAARHCVDLLAEGLKQDPHDPRRSLWLAEALLRIQRDMRTWASLRSVTDPSSVASRTGIEDMSGLCQEAGGGDAPIRLLKTAFYRARSAAAEPVAAHVLARVYLQRGRPQDALRLARLAGSKAPGERRDLLITAALAFVALEQRDDAVRVAERAIEQGNSLGYAVLARLRATDRSSLSRDAVRHAKECSRLRQQVRVEDRVRYHGAARTRAEAVLAVRSAQWRKLNATLSDAVGMPPADMPLDAGAPTEPVVETEWTATEFFVEWIEPIDGAVDELPLADPFQPAANAAVALPNGARIPAAALDGGSGRGGG